MTFHLFWLTSSFFLISSIKSEVFNVGDDNLWSDGVAYDLWSQKYTFHVGDVLEFKYPIGTHNVYEVTKATYQTCDASTGVLAKYESGDDKIALKAPRMYWFLCNIEGHCLGGMRFGIKVVNSNSTTSISNNSSLPPSLSPSNNAITRKIDTSYVLGAGISLLIYIVSSLKM